MWHLLGRNLVRWRTLLRFLCWLLQQTHYCSKQGFAERWGLVAILHVTQRRRAGGLDLFPEFSTLSTLSPLPFFPFQGGPVLKGSRQTHTFIVRYNKSYQLVHLILWQQSITFIWFRLVWNWAESVSWKACLDWQTPEADAARAVIPNKKMPWEISNNKETLNRPPFRTVLWAHTCKTKWWAGRSPVLEHGGAEGRCVWGIPTADPPLREASPGWTAEKAKSIDRKTP